MILQCFSYFNFKNENCSEGNFEITFENLKLVDYFYLKIKKNIYLHNKRTS